MIWTMPPPAGAENDWPIRSTPIGEGAPRSSREPTSTQSPFGSIEALMRRRSREQEGTLWPHPEVARVAREMTRTFNMPKGGGGFIGVPPGGPDDACA